MLICWRINTDPNVLSFGWLAFLLSQLEVQSSESRLPSSAITFLRRYAGPWPSRKWTEIDWFAATCVRDGAYFIQYHMSFLSQSQGHESIGPLEDVRCHRTIGNLQSLASKIITPIVERRFSLALYTTYDLDLHEFVLVILSDSEEVFWVLRRKDRKEGWFKAKILPCFNCTGIVAFQFRIY